MVVTVSRGEARMDHRDHWGESPPLVSAAIGRSTGQRAIISATEPFHGSGFILGRASRGAFMVES